MAQQAAAKRGPGAGDCLQVARRNRSPRSRPHIRQVRPEDEAGLSRFLEDLSAESRYHRFLGMSTHLARWSRGEVAPGAVPLERSVPPRPYLAELERRGFEVRMRASGR